MNFLNKLEYRSFIGSGYFSNVNEYRHRETGVLYAVKEIKKEFQDADQYKHWFEREVRFLEQLRGHPNIIQIIKSDLDAGRYRYIMPRAAFNIYDFVKSNNQTLELADRCAIFESVANAIAHAHAQKILHRDINPSNVLLCEEDDGFVVKVADFGLGKDWESLSAFTHSGVANYGQPYYVAPEQRAKLKDANERSDIFSLGKLLNFIMTGRDPDNIHECAFVPVIRKATSYEPEKRYDSVDAMIADYERLKSLVAPNPGEIDSELLHVYAETLEQIDWQQFHLLAVAGDYEGHVYSGYIEPVVSILDNASRAAAYCDFAGEAVKDFLSMFLKRLRECYGQTGWPFSSLDSFGDMLYQVYLATQSNDGKLQCLIELWHIAYAQDQWHVQRLVERLLPLGKLPSALHQEVAVMILDTKAQRAQRDLLNLTLPSNVKNAIRLKLKELDIPKE